MKQALTPTEYDVLKLFLSSPLSLRDERIDRDTAVDLIRRNYLVLHEIESIPFSDSIVVGSAVIPKSYALSKTGRTALKDFEKKRHNRRLAKAGTIIAFVVPTLISIIALIAEHGATIVSWFKQLFSR